MSGTSAIYKSVVITTIRQENIGVKTFTVTCEDGSPVPYQSGQFITFVFTIKGIEERRSYSISSSAELGEPLSFTVKRIENGTYSRLLVDKSEPGDKLQTSGVAGLFRLPQDFSKYQQFFFFAAGIGITPEFSLIKTLLNTHPKTKAVLIFSNRWQESVVFFDEINALQAKFSERFRVEFLYSTSYHLERARLNKALLPVLLKEYSEAPKSAMLFYVCGPYNYMRMVNLALEEQGVESDQIRKENFRPFERPVIKTEPRDQKAYKVTIRRSGAEQTFICQYPDSILEAAKKNGIALPYSCEIGRCGSCSGKCVKGKVWMSYDEVLMDTDTALGIVLTCTGHPVGGDVVIEL